MTDEAPLLSAHALCVRRQRHTIIHNVELAVHAREIVTLVGPNGGGKTTLLHALLGLIPASDGEVRRRGDLVAGFVPQRMQGDPVLPLRVREFMALSHRAGVSPTPEGVLERLGCGVLLDRPLHALSGGETQRVLLGRALMRRPNLLVLDEPAQGVDMGGVQEIYALLESLRREDGMGVLMVSHDIHFVMATTDRVLCLNRHLCCSGEPILVSHHPEFRALFGEIPVGVSVYPHHHDHRHGLGGEIKRRG